VIREATFSWQHDRSGVEPPEERTPAAFVDADFVDHKVRRLGVAMGERGRAAAERFRGVVN
jgi:hypothetical protein